LQPYASKNRARNYRCVAKEATPLLNRNTQNNRSPRSPWLVERMLIVALTTSLLGVRLILFELWAKLQPWKREQIMRASAQLFVRTLENLGATYVKFGQLLAMRPDFLPLVYIEELSRLLDNVRPFSTPVAIRIIEQELGQPLHKLFRSFSEEPIASASFGQVYRAELPDGQLVAVKVQRPGMERLVQADLKLMALMARIVDFTTLLLTVKMTEFYYEFKSYTLQELDYMVEARNIHRLYLDALDSELERIPAVHWDHTTARVLTMEYLEGIWVNDILEALAANDEDLLTSWSDEGLDLEVAASRLIYVLMRQAFLHGTFHADPHAANIVILKGNAIGLVDFGIIGTIGGDFQRNMFQLMRRMGEGSPSGAFASILRVLVPEGHVNLRSFKRDYESNMQDWLDTARDPLATISEKSVARLILANLLLIRRYGLHLPAAVARFYRSLLIADSVAIQLSPQMNMVTELRDIMTRISIERLIRNIRPESYWTALLGYESIFLELPGVISQLLDSEILTKTLEATHSLERNVLAAGHWVRLTMATLMRVAALVFSLAAVVLAVRRAAGTAQKVHLGSWSYEWWVLSLGLLVASVVAIWISRNIRGRSR
jgi:ubiquinone biosynthesis protein